MISYRRPPFGTSRVIAAILSCANRPSFKQIESAYAHTYRVPYAILLPSARAGICWALQASIEQGSRVICPAYTCRVVWESIIRAGGKLDLIDTAKGSFLMDHAALRRSQAGNYAIVLCEIYGYTYNPSTVTSLAAADPAIRIVDMAMTVPTASIFERLADRDFAVVSFGNGKCMYAGWGGMGFTRDKLLAGKVREMRDSALARCGFSVFAKRSVKMIARNLLNEPVAYRFLRKVRDTRHSKRQRYVSSRDGSTIYSIAKQPVCKEWFLPSTYVDRYLMVYNLKRTEQYRERRVTLARRYHNNFEGVPGVIRPDTSPHALSHYTIRVKPSLRPRVKKHLNAAGIDAGTLFFFPASLSKSDYPNASRIASEVLNLPLDVRLSVSDVDWICQNVARAVKCWGQSTL